jgi:hypothetical protein
MTTAAPEDKIVEILVGIVALLGGALDMMVELIDKPEFLDAGTSTRVFDMQNQMR